MILPCRVFLMTRVRSPATVWELNMLDSETMALSNTIDDCIYKMRPSDRLRLEGYLADANSEHLVIEAIVRYVEGWEGSSWIEDYSITRIGKWFARHAGRDRIERLRCWAQDGDSEPRRAFLEGLNTPGRSRPASDQLKGFSAQVL